MVGGGCERTQSLFRYFKPTVFQTPGQGGFEFTDGMGKSLNLSSAQVGSQVTLGALNWKAATYKDDLKGVIRELQSFSDAMSTESSRLAQGLLILTTREEFLTEKVSLLDQGSDKLILADLNEESANLLALQTASRLSTQALSLASEQAQSVLRLIA